MPKPMDTLKQCPEDFVSGRAGTRPEGRKGLLPLPLTPTTAPRRANGMEVWSHLPITVERKVLRGDTCHRVIR